MPTDSLSGLREAYECAQIERNERRWCAGHDALQPCVHCEVNAAESLIAALESALTQAEARITAGLELLDGIGALTSTERKIRRALEGT